MESLIKNLTRWLPFVFYLMWMGPLSAQVLTPTLPPSATPVWTLTPTAAWTATPTPTPTLTSSLTLISTSTGTIQPTLTPTFTETPTLTPTLTPTSTPTFTPTLTSTPGVFKFSVSPKPDASGVINFSWGTTIPADEAFLKIYTSGFRVVREFYFNKNENSEYLSSGIHDFAWDGKDENKRALPPASYLCFIDVNVGKKKYEASGKTEIP